MLQPSNNFFRATKATGRCFYKGINPIFPARVIVLKFVIYPSLN